jgi:beta-N-acetylhexosaminidase
LGKKRKEAQKRKRVLKENPLEKNKDSNKLIQEKIFIVLIALILMLAVLNLAKARGMLIPENEKIPVVDGRINLGEISLEQKIAQMVIVQGDRSFLEVWQRMQVGGIHLFARQTESIFNNTIIDFQYGMGVPFLVTADMEGCISPFEHLHESKPLSQMRDENDAYLKGKNDGAYLKGLGFNLNFAPVVDLEDKIWKCRSFKGDEKKIAKMAESYVEGLQSQGVMATAKHYPGKTLVVNDPHKNLVSAEISSADVYPYIYLAEKDEVKAVMVSHVISSGEVDSQGVPAVVSAEAIGELKKEYSGLIISDEIHMLGLKSFYPTVEEMYIAVFKAGNDLVINFDRDPNEVYRMILVIKKAVEEGDISEEQIDNSVRKILEAKGFEVVG